MIAPHALRVEHLGDDPLGVGERRSRLSWQLPDRCGGQQAFYGTALGVYEAQLNGRRIGDHVLAPGTTATVKLPDGRAAFDVGVRVHEWRTVT